MPAPGFGFANPRPSPDDFNTFSPQDVFADSKIRVPPKPEPVPKPWRTPPVLPLAQVLDAGQITQIQSSGRIVFHAAGDTGGIKEPSHQFAVADAMTADLSGKDFKGGRPAFFFHLGDVVYYFGQGRYYYDQFYDPYRDYDAPIFAIPGNHDGVMFPREAAKYSLEPFWRNFCTKKPVRHPAAQGSARTTMTQPGVYFTLDAPFARIIGLYSNTSEGATEGLISGNVVGPGQLTFLKNQLQAAAQSSKNQKRALLIAVHHPPFTGSSQHVPSPKMLTDIDSACQAAGVWPDAVLSGHAHLYERYTRVKGGRQIPYVVAGTGGYFNLSGFRVGRGGATPRPPVTGNDGKGNPLTLEAFNDKAFGFLRLTVDASSLFGEFVALDRTTGRTSTADKFKLDLNTHKLI